MFSRWPLKLLVALASNVLLASADSPQIVDLGYATYQGTLSSATNVTSFFGVRFAAPPLGKFLYFFVPLRIISHLF